MITDGAGAFGTRVPKPSRSQTPILLSIFVSDGFKIENPVGINVLGLLAKMHSKNAVRTEPPVKKKSLINS